MRPIRSAKGFLAELRRLDHGVSADTLLIANATVYMTELLEKLAKQAKVPESYPEYRLFIAYQTKIEGRTLEEAAELWEQRKTEEVKQ